MTIYEDENQNLYVYIYTNDHIPPHVHIFKRRKNEANIYQVKINIGSQNEPPEIVKANPKMKGVDIKAAWELVVIHQEAFLAKWNEIHGIQRLEKSSKRGGVRCSNR